MDDIFELLQGEIGKQVLQGTASETGQSVDKTQDLLQLALPVLLGAMKKNTQSEEGSKGLYGAISQKHDGSILDQLGTLFEGGYTQEVLNDGAGILGHVLGHKQPQVEAALGNQVGMNATDVSRILKMVAPILLGYLGKQQRSRGVQSPAGLGDLLGGLMGKGASGQQQGLIEAFLDADGDGSVVDDLTAMLLKDKGKGGIGDMLGGLFGK